MGYLLAWRMFTHPDLFELEMTHIFEGNWIYLATATGSPASTRLPDHHHGPASRLQHRA